MTTVEPVRHSGRLDAVDVADVLSFAAETAAADGVDPFSEQVLLHVRKPSDDAHVVHLIVRSPGGDLAGYAFVDLSDPDGGPTAELAVHPRHRRHGLGRALVSAALDAARAADSARTAASARTADSARTAASARTADSARTASSARTADGPGRLSVWAHGDEPAARALADRTGFERVRVLWQMRRPLPAGNVSAGGADLPDVPLPDGVALRTFRPGADDAAWLAVNARAFAHHPEQGRWTAEDLRLRMAEPWFDPAGFLLAVDTADDRLLGFHWTKVHAAHGPDPAIGEIYVLGVDPGGHRRGLGAALSVAGLRHLAGLGLTTAMLYVDESNPAAVALYKRLGFTVHSTDVAYRHTV